MRSTTTAAFRNLVLSGLFFALPASCVTAPPPQPPKPAAKPAPKPVDAKAQKQYYDMGLQYYSGDNYGQAKEAFLQAVEYGPNTPLGLKAQENLKKIDQILKTLEEIESK